MLYFYLRSLELNFLHFGLDLCIVNKGEKVMHEKCCIWKVFQQDRQALEHFCWQGGHTGRSDRLASGVTGPGGLTAQGTRSDRPGQWMSELLLFGLHLFRGSFHVLAYVQGELFWFIALVVLLLEYRWRGALLASPVRSRYELCSQVDLVSVLCLDF